MARKKTTRTARAKTSKLGHSPFFIIEDFIKRFVEQERKRFNGSDDKFQKVIRAKLRKISSELSQELLAVIAKSCIQARENTRKYASRVVRKVASNHKGSLELFDFLIQFNSLIGQECYLRWHEKLKTLDDHLKLETLIEIHSRACQVASEINLLVKNGYADGAQARWRSLHELCIVFLFLYDNDNSVVKMYIDYEVIEWHDKLKKYQDAHPKLNWKPIRQAELDRLSQERQQLIDTYGKDFAKSYGWTMSVLQPGQRNIRGIEQAVSKDSLRGIYSWASENVHAGILGNKNRLGLPKGKEHFLLTGASEFGLFDPIQFTSFSLSEMTEVLLGVDESILTELYIQTLWGFHTGMVKLLLKEVKKVKAKNH